MTTSILSFALTTPPSPWRGGEGRTAYGMATMTKINSRGWPHFPRIGRGGCHPSQINPIIITNWLYWENLLVLIGVGTWDFGRIWCWDLGKFGDHVLFHE